MALSLISICSSLFVRFTMVLVIFSLHIFAFSMISFSLSTTFRRRLSLRSRRCLCLLSELFRSSLKNKTGLSLLRLSSSCRNFPLPGTLFFFYLMSNVITSDTVSTERAITGCTVES